MINTGNPDLNGLALIDLLHDSIYNGDQDLLESILQSMDMNLVEPDSMDRLLSDLLELCFEEKQGSLALVIYNHFAEYNHDDETFSLLAIALGKHLFSIESLKYLIAQMRDQSFESLFQQLLTRDDSQELMIACRRLFEIYNVNTATELKKVIEVLDIDEKENNNRMVYLRDFIISRYREVSEPAPKPSWIRPPGSDPLDPLTGLGTAFEVASDLDPRTEVVSIQEMIKRLKMDVDPDLFREYGPSHPSGIDDKDSPCSKYGGCRMFLCICSDQDLIDSGVDPDPMEPEPWFNGNCDNCGLKISDSRWSVRQPCAHGGWDGCYCSWSCVRKNMSAPFIVVDEREQGEEICEREEIVIDGSGTRDDEYMTVMELIDLFELQIGKIGITP